jgi:hypothetical protein
LHMLRMLNFCDNNLYEDGGKAIGRLLPFITSLEVLYLEGNQLGPQGGIAVAEGVERLQCLRSLDLRDNAIGPDCCSKVAQQLSHMQNLHLDLRYNDLERRGRGKKLASSYSRLLPGHQASQRKLSMAATPQMIIRGWLKKLNRVNEGEMLDVNNWRDRLCFVCDNKMFYKSAKKKGEDEEVADLSEIQRASAAQYGWQHGYYIFYVEVQGKRKMIFSASSQDERAQWIDVLTSKTAKRAAACPIQERDSP